MSEQIDSKPENNILQEQIEKNNKVEDICGFETYEGSVLMLHIARCESGFREVGIPLKARVIVGKDLPRGGFYDRGWNQHPDAFSTLFFNGLSKLTVSIIGITDEEIPQFSPEHKVEEALRAVIENYRANPDVPITLVYAHGDVKENEFYISVDREGTGSVPIRTIINELTERNSGLGDNKEGKLSLIISGCNSRGVNIQDDRALIVYRKGICSLLKFTGNITVSRPK